MNKDQAINILIDEVCMEHVTMACQNKDEVQAAVLVLQKYLNDNKKDAKVEVTGLQFNLTKGI